MISDGKSVSSLLSARSKYKISDKIGSGAYGEVFRGVRDDDGVSVALKRIMITDDDDINNIPLSTHRELNVLRRLNCIGNENIVKLFDIVLNKVNGRMCVDIVFELSDCDLESYLLRVNKGGDLPLSKVINLGSQLMNGVHFMHSNRVIHRDLKPANILIDQRGTNLKITDFGLARVLGFDASLTPVAVTLWYRSPEILFKNKYLTACDIWSVGCIIGEMVFGRPLFAADDEFKQMEKIVSRLGYEATDNWPEEASFNFSTFVKSVDPARSLDRVLKRADHGLRSLIKALLRFNPDHRMLSGNAQVILEELRKTSSVTTANGCTCYTSSCSLECSLDSQNRMLVNSVVRNVFDDDSADIQIPGLTDHTSIEEYPHEQVELNGLTDVESSDGDYCDNVRNSFGDYRTRDNQSFSSYTTSQTGADSASDDEVIAPKDFNELREFHEGFALSDSDSDTCYRAEGGSRSLDISETTTNKDGDDLEDIMSADSRECPLSTKSAVNLSSVMIGSEQPARSESADSLLVQDEVTSENTLPLRPIQNICTIDLVSPNSPRINPFTRKRIISPNDSEESDIDHENIWGPVCKTKPTITRHKSLRRRLSMVGPPASSDRKSLCRRGSTLVSSTIGENEEIQNRSFGEHSLSRPLGSVEKHVESALTARPKVIVRRRSQWK